MLWRAAGGRRLTCDSASCALADALSLRRRITTRLLEFVSAEESFLRGIPADSDSIVVLHPRVGHRHPRARDLDSAAVLSHLAVLAQERGALHKKWCVCAWSPLKHAAPAVLLWTARAR
jgi:hypothetical protein